MNVIFNFFFWINKLQLLNKLQIMIKIIIKKNSCNNFSVVFFKILVEALSSKNFVSGCEQPYISIKNSVKFCAILGSQKSG